MNHSIYRFCIGLSCWCLFSLLPAQAQDTLTLEAAIETALSNNYGIQVAEYTTEISANSATPGQAGMMPSLDAAGGYTYSNSSTKVTFANPSFEEVDASGVVNQSNNGSLALTYRLFGGFGAKNNYRVLQQSVMQSREQTRLIIENTISQVVSAYYEVARLSGTYDILLETIQVSRERLTRVNNQRDFGSATRLDVLNAEVDMNTDSVNLQTAELNLQNAQQNLLTLIGDDTNSAFETTQKVEFMPEPIRERIMQTAITQNASVSLAEQALRISEINLKVAEAARYPTLDLSGGYGFNNANNGPGNIVQTQGSLGFTGGASVNFNLFNGSRTRTNIQNSQITIASNKAQYDDAVRSLRRDLANAIRTYRNSLNIIELEQKSLTAASLNFESTAERYKLGQVSNVDFRTAQFNLLQTQNRLNDLRYSAKLAETEILRLSGELVPE